LGRFKTEYLELEGKLKVCFAEKNLEGY